jgi:glycosyltransferase involved in cell wall biosynthesis
MAPALAELKQRYGAPCNVITWRSSHAIRPIYEGTGLVRDVYWLKDHRLPIPLSPHKLHFLRWLKTEPKSDVFFFIKRDSSLEVVLSVFRRAGFQDDHFVMRNCWSDDQHESESILQTVRERVASDTPVRPFSGRIQPGLIGVTDQQRQDASQLLRATGVLDSPLVMVQMGNRKTMNPFRFAGRASNKKYWPDKHWSKVIDGLLQSDDSLSVLLCGAGSEWSYLEKMRRRMGSNRVVNLARQLPLETLKGLSTQARALISVDTGIAHLAAALGCPTVVLFGPAAPRRYCPLSLGNPVHCIAKYQTGEAEQRKRPDIRMITPDEVLRAAEPLLKIDQTFSRFEAGSDRVSPSFASLPLCA